MRSESGTSGDGTASRFHAGAIDNCVPTAGGGSKGGGGGAGGSGSHTNERINRFVDAASRFPPLGIDIPAPAGKITT